MCRWNKDEVGLDKHTNEEPPLTINGPEAIISHWLGDKMSPTEDPCHKLRRVIGFANL